MSHPVMSCEVSRISELASGLSVSQGPGWVVKMSANEVLVSQVSQVSQSNNPSSPTRCSPTTLISDNALAPK
jgi:hypothetical protein